MRANSSKQNSASLRSRCGGSWYRHSWQAQKAK